MPNPPFQLKFRLRTAYPVVMSLLLPPGGSVLAGLAAGIAFAAIALPARLQAAVVAEITQYDDGVQVVMKGSLNLDDLVYLYTNALDAPVGQIDPSAAFVFGGPKPRDPSSTNPGLAYTCYDVYRGTIYGDGPFGSGELSTFYFPSVDVRGRAFGFELFGSESGLFGVPKSYSSQGNIFTQVWLPGASRASIGISLGEFRYSWGAGDHADHLIVRVSARDGLRPVSGPLPLLGFSSAWGWSRRLRRRCLSLHHQQCL